MRAPRLLSSIIADARVRCEMECARGSDWTFHNMSEGERSAFDAWLVSVNHVLAHEAGTTETRFRQFMSDLVIGRYRGPLP